MNNTNWVITRIIWLLSFIESKLRIKGYSETIVTKDKEINDWHLEKYKDRWFLLIISRNKINSFLWLLLRFHYFYMTGLRVHVPSIRKIRSGPVVVLHTLGKFTNVSKRTGNSVGMKVPGILSTVSNPSSRPFQILSTTLVTWVRFKRTFLSC